MLAGQVVDQLHVALLQIDRHAVLYRSEVDHVDGLCLDFRHGRHAGATRGRCRAGDWSSGEAECGAMAIEIEQKGTAVPVDRRTVPLLVSLRALDIVNAILVKDP